VLIPIVESLWLQSGPVVRAAAQIHDEQGGLAATDHHWAMIEAIETGDVDAAMQALANDIGRSFDLVRARLDAGEQAA
jgi:DNA-binding GntR family transcriptional regulator